MDLEGMEGISRIVEPLVLYFGGVHRREGGRVMGRVVRGFTGWVGPL